MCDRDAIFISRICEAFLQQMTMIVFCVSFTTREPNTNDTQRFLGHAEQLWTLRILADKTATPEYLQGS